MAKRCYPKAMSPYFFNRSKSDSTYISPVLSSTLVLRLVGCDSTSVPLTMQVRFDHQDRTVSRPLNDEHDSGLERNPHMLSSSMYNPKPRILSHLDKIHLLNPGDLFSRHQKPRNIYAAQGFYMDGYDHHPLARPDVQTSNVYGLLAPANDHHTQCRMGIGQLKQHLLDTIDGYKCGLEKKLLVVSKLQKELEAELRQLERARINLSQPRLKTFQASQAALEQTRRASMEPNHSRAFEVDRAQRLSSIHPNISHKAPDPERLRRMSFS